MIIYYSGQGTLGQPERVLKEKANIMLTFIDSCKRPQKRFLKIYKARKRKGNKK